MTDDQKNDDVQAESNSAGVDPVQSDDVVEDQVEEVVAEPEAVVEDVQEEAVQGEVAEEAVEEVAAPTTEESPVVEGEEPAATDQGESAQAAPAPAAQSEGGKTDGAGLPAQAGFTDQQLVCRECGSAFVWTAGEQAFYAEKGFDNPPVRCPNCRQLKKQKRMESSHSGPREGVQITCSRCGKQDMVPFAPKGDKPVLCWDCYRATRSR